MLEPSTAVSPPAFPIVGVGASAGGLEAFGELLRCVPPNADLAFVLIQHLDRTHSSLLSDVLQKSTTMPVSEAEHGQRVESGHVYVIAPNTELALAEGCLALSPRRSEGTGASLPVDAFMRSLAADIGSRAIGVILSGSASDGTEGLRAIKAQDGFTLVQRPESARFAGMPQSAVDAGVVDRCLEIPELAGELVRLSRHSYVQMNAAEGGEQEAGVRRRILARVQSAFGIDFGEFKPATISRRLARRLALRGVADMTAYSLLLDKEPDEVRALYEDLLIHVTGFFRDPEVFEALRTTVLPEIYQRKAADAPVRIWVAGCSTGEEVYSIAILCIEHAMAHPESHPIQIFGTDVSEVAIRKARAGVYEENALGGLSEEHRRRYLTKVDGGFRIDKGVRERCIFVCHDVVRDPPFSKVDLVCCRNVLIYFDAALQKKVVPLLHYALGQPGFLVLGRSESISAFEDLFSVVDKTHKIFRRSEGASGLRFEPRLSADARLQPTVEQRVAEAGSDSARLGRHVDQLLLARYAPAGVLIDEQMNVILYRGQTGAFLQAAPGQPQHNLINLARDGLVAALRIAVAQAQSEQVPVRQAGVVVENGDSSLRCDVVVIPFSGVPDINQSLFIVLFEGEPHIPRDAASDRAPVRVLEVPAEVRRSARLEHELAATRTYLHTLVEEHGRANDELAGLNEELVSGNEELQSMNEELETAKEELQSTNEELTTLNDELRARNQDVETLAAEAQGARSQAERSNRAKDDFLATLSHELRTPLSTMLLKSQQLRLGGPSEPSALVRVGEVLERATWAQVRLIDDLLDVSRIVAGKFEPNRLRADFGKLVRAALESATPLIEAKSLSLTVSIDPDAGDVWVDTGRLQQAVSNLLANAVKFTPSGGEVMVTVSRLESAASLKITDSGIGISAEFLPHVFTRFSQNDTSITRKYGGLGLGLALVRHIVELHGGSVGAESAGEGQGASFTITLPLAPLDAKSAPPIESERPKPLDRPGMTRRYDELDGLRVLFVDDDPGTRDAVREVLQYTGAIVELAASAAEGVAALERFRPDVLLCDIAMPEEDGYSLMRKVRSREQSLGSSIPALALTALASEEDRRRALAAGFNMHVAKPIDIDLLRDTVLKLSRRVRR
jgi:chemotaxis methyl-accepting protein methylase/signal transduction histidine kinase/chemotaxis response regulator CheB